MFRRCPFVFLRRGTFFGATVCQEFAPLSQVQHTGFTWKHFRISAYTLCIWQVCQLCHFLVVSGHMCYRSCCSGQVFSQQRAERFWTRPVHFLAEQDRCVPGTCGTFGTFADSVSCSSVHCSAQNSDVSRIPSARELSAAHSWHQSGPASFSFLLFKTGVHRQTGVLFCLEGASCSATETVSVLMPSQ